MALHAAKRNVTFGHNQCQRSKESSSRKKREVFFYRMRVRAEIKKKQSYSNERSKSRYKRTFIEKEDRREREGQFVELVDDQNPSAEAPARSKRRGSKGDVKRDQLEISWRFRTLRGR